MCVSVEECVEIERRTRSRLESKTQRSEEAKDEEEEEEEEARAAEGRPERKKGQWNHKWL